MKLQKFDDVYHRALDRKGGEAELTKWIPETLTATEISKIAIDRFLSEMTRCIFQAGFVYRVINQKWSGFEEAFWEFEPRKLVLISPEQIENLIQDTRIVRNPQKIKSVPINAQFIMDIEKSEGSFSNWIATWPSENLIGLLSLLKKRGSRLGGMTGQRLLRNMGKETFILTSDVVLCLQQAGLDIRDNPTSMRDMKAIQEAFNEWQQQSSMNLSQISRIAACSVGDNYSADSDSDAY